MVEFFDSSEDIISMLKKVEPYVIKIKCIACSETQFMPFHYPIIDDSTVTIGCCSYPLHLIEYVVVKYKEDVGIFSVKTKEIYKVKARYLQTLLSEQAL